MRSIPRTSPPAVALAAALALTLGSGVSAAAETPPSGCDRPEARQFDFWLGEWDVVNKRLQPDGGWPAVGTATVRVHPVVGGCGVVEHWEGSLGSYWLTGFSMRTWDPRSSSWHLVLSWPPPGEPGFSLLEGRFTHGRGELFAERQGSDGEEWTERYTFSDIRPDAFRWDAARSEDGSHWRTYWIMEFSRRPPGSPPLFNGPWVVDRRERRCPGEEVAALDFLAGRWRTADEGEELRVRTLPILDGCAQIETTSTGGRETRFAVRAWDSRSGTWVEYALAAGRPGFVRLAGRREDGALVFESVAEAGDGEPVRPLRRTYRAAGDGLELETGDGGAGRRLEPADLTPARTD